MLTRKCSGSRSSLRIHALILVMCLMVPFQLAAKEGTASSASPPYSYRHYHVHYDVKTDGTYVEQDEVEMSVDTEQGIQRAKQMLVGMHNMEGPGLGYGKKEVEVLTAYTLKKNGQHIEAILSDPQAGKVLSSSNVIPNPPAAEIMMAAFQQVALGDTLVYSYRVKQTVPISPNSVLLIQNFPKWLVYDDVAISLIVPAAYDLRIETVGLKKDSVTDIGGVRNYVWKFQNKQAEVLQPGKSVLRDSPPGIHITSFRDDASETAFFKQKMAAFIPNKLALEEIVARLIKQAEAGDANDQYNVGYAYENGTGVTKDAAKAVEWYKKSAAQGNTNAQTRLGDIYRFGRGVSKDAVAAAMWYQNAAVQGDSDAQTRLGLMYEAGEGVPKDAIKAAEWYQKAALQDDVPAQFYLSLMYEKGEGVAKDAANAESWFKKAAAYGWEGTNGLNTYLNLSPDPAKSLVWFKKGAELGNAFAQYRLAEIYQFDMSKIFGNGSGVRNDNDKAFVWYQKAAVQGHAKAQYNLGDMYRYGKGTTADADKAFEWYQKAAGQGDMEMQKSIQKIIKTMYANGEVRKGQWAALGWKSSAADIHLITATSIGPVKLGMTLGEAKKLLPSVAKFERAENAEGIALIAIMLGKENLMLVYAGEEHFNSAIDWSKRIEYIETFNSQCHTADSIHPGSTVLEVEKVLGKTKEVSVSEIKAREYIDFERQSKRFLFRSDAAGIFADGNARQTMKSNPNGTIMSIMVSSDFSD